MLEPEWLDEAIHSASPSSRLKAASWMKNHPDVLPVGTIMRAMQRESVPQIRQVFNDVLETRAALTTSVTGAPSSTESSSSQSAIPELARLIRHELSPPIGWIRRAGNREIDDFRRSATGDAVNRLERRLDALISLIRSESELELVRCNLEHALREAWPDPTALPTFSAAPDTDPRQPDIRTDEGLFEILMANVYQNAIDAALEVPDGRPIHVAWSIVGDRFWVRVSNAFAGTQFDIRDVAATGITTKSGHQGIGVSLIKTASTRLGYGFRVAGRSGLATFTLTGGRT